MPKRPISPGWLPLQAGSARAVLTHELMLAGRLYLFVLARYLVAALIVAGAIVARFVVGVEDLRVGSLVAIAVFIATYNTVILRLNAGKGDRSAEPEVVRLRRMLLAASIVLDFLSLWVAAWFVGGARSPFVVFFLFHIVIASLFLSRRGAFASALMATAMVVALVAVEVTGLVPPPLPVGAVSDDAPLDPRYAVTLVVVYLGLFLVIVASQTHVAGALRESELEMQRRTEEARSVSGMRRDFLMVALHDVNAPVGAASLLLRNLQEGLCGPLAPAQRAQVARALVQLDSLERLVRDLRTLGELDTTDLDAHSTEVSLSFLVLGVVDEASDAARAKGLALAVEETSPPAIVYGVPRLLREAIANYVSNAIKYTPEGGSISCRVRSVNGWFRLEVTDTGVGISEQDRSRLFEEFVRVGQERPEVRTVRGTGLGLSIVRRIAVAHRGRVGVDSTRGAGSTFWMELPACTGDEEQAPSSKL